MTSHNLYQWFEHHSPQSLVCTPNQRLARFLQSEYSAYQKSRYPEQRVYQPLNVIALELWQSELIRKALLLGSLPSASTILSPLQKRAIWQTILTQDEDVLDAGDLVDVAIEADNLIQRWGLDKDALETEYAAATHHEFALWLRWERLYQAQCDTQQYQDRESAFNGVLQAMERGELTDVLPQHVVFTGFDQWVIPHQRFESALTAAGVTVNREQIFQNTSAPMDRIGFNSAKSELYAAAEWAKQASEQGQNVALVIPDLGQRLSEVERVLTHTFSPEAAIPGKEADLGHYNISSGLPLAQTPLVQAALALLSWQGADKPVGELKALFLAPFVGTDQKQEAAPWLSEQASRLDCFNRITQRHVKVSLFQLRAAVAQYNADYQASYSDGSHLESSHDGEAQPQNEQPTVSPLATFYSQLDETHQLWQAAGSHKRSMSEWQAHFEALLTLWDWPGARTLNSAEYQQHQQWLVLTAELKQFDAVMGKIGLSTALQLLAQTLKTPFHKQTPAAKVQILGVLEASGQLFDRLWWLGLDSQSWPEPLQPNPLLPARLQREQSMPRASATSEAAYAQTITQRMLQSADHVIVSHARFNGDEPLSPSPLIQSLAERTWDEPAALHPWQTLPAITLQAQADQVGLPIPTPCDLKGGTSALKDQAQCPFRAYAIHRLKAKALDEAVDVFEPRDRGNLIHTVLEFIWHELKSQEQLLASSDEALEILVQQAIDENLPKISRHRNVGERFLMLEAERTQRRVKEWLQLEKSRQPFEVILQEKTLPIELEGLRFRLRMDRVDCLSDGKTLAIIDYKTGTTSLKRWLWPRIEEPQIPLYATAMKDIGAAVFAEVNAKSMQFVGLTDNAALFDELTDLTQSNASLWPEHFMVLLDHWRQDLTALAASFAQGYAAVDPKGDACKWCDLQTFCRVSERSVHEARQESLVAKHALVSSEKPSEKPSEKLSEKQSAIQPSIRQGGSL